MDDDGDDEAYFSSSVWVLVTADAAWFATPAFQGATLRAPKLPKTFRPWTDDYSNLFQLLSL